MSIRESSDVVRSLCLLIDKPQQSVPGVNAMEKATALKRDLLDSIERLGDRLPPNTLDQLIDELGGPDCVAEVHHYLFSLSLHYFCYHSICLQTFNFLSNYHVVVFLRGIVLLSAMKIRESSDVVRSLLLRHQGSLPWELILINGRLP